MIALDASAVIYLLKKNQSDPDGERGRKVAEYAAEAISAGIDVALPTVALSEVLAVPGMDADSVFGMLDDYDMLDFNTKAALVAGEIACSTNWKSAIPAIPGGRQLVKLDILIAGTAIANRATIILTNDHRYDRFVVNRPIRIVLVDSLPQP